MESKKVLIQEYKEGKLNDLAFHSLSAYNHLMIVHIDDEMVFGYHQFLQEPKNFFRVKLHTHEDGILFNIQHHVYNLNDFMRVR